MSNDYRECIEPGCHEPAGTPWTDVWCVSHDEERRERITKSLEAMTVGEATDGE